jgi:mono/diheme cytochrome c family protein
VSRVRLVRGLSFAGLALALTACQQRMAHPPQYRPLQETEFFPDRRSSRPLEEGVVHRAQILDDDPLASGLTADGKQPQTVQIKNEDGTDRATKTGPGLPSKPENFVNAFPFQMTEADVKRGQERYQIYCVPCHDPVGNGRGKIVERGFLAPPNFHADNSRGFAFYNVPLSLRNVPPGYIFEVISKGYGGMPEYAAQIPIADRWRIAAYVRVLQLSQNVDRSKLTPQQQAELDRATGGGKK